MSRMIIAKRLGNKIVISNDGEYLGKVIDLTINENTGKIEHIILEPNVENPLMRGMRKINGYVHLPYASVMAASDYLLVDRKLISRSDEDINNYF